MATQLKRVTIWNWWSSIYEALEVRRGTGYISVAITNALRRHLSDLFLSDDGVRTKETTKNVVYSITTTIDISVNNGLLVRRETNY